jgi:hypothetical protein
MKKLRQQIGMWILNRKLKKISRRVQGKNFNSAQKAGILFTYQNPQDLKKVKEYIKDLRSKGFKEVYAIGFAPAKKTHDHFQPFLGLDLFTLKDVNFAFIPNATVTKNFIQEDLDYLFVPEKQIDFPLLYLLALSKAKLKIGFDNTPFTRYLDFMINGNLTETQFFTHSEKYLSKIA